MTANAPAAARDPRALIAFVLMTLIWGSTWYAIRLQQNGTPMFVSVALRFFLAAVLLAGWMQVVRAPFRVDRRLWPWIPLQASCIYGINYLFAYGATAYVVSGIVALSFALNVVFSLMLEPVVLGRRSPRTAWFGAALGLAGLAIVLGPGLVVTDDRATLIGIAMALAGAAIVGLGAVISARMLGAGASAYTLNFYGFLVGALIAAIAATVSGDGWRMQWTHEYVASLLYLSLFGSIIAFAMYLYVVRTLGPITAGYSSIISPLIALCLSMILEGFRADWVFAAGVVMVLAGNITILRGRTARARGASR